MSSKFRLKERYLETRHFLVEGFGFSSILFCTKKQHVGFVWLKRELRIVDCTGVHLDPVNPVRW
jgi:hypothetical protein